MSQTERNIFESVLPRCPMEKLVPNFPCPGPQKHQLNHYDDNPGAPCGRGDTLCRIVAFSDLRYSTTCAGKGEYINGTTKLLERTLIGAVSNDIEAIVQLGGVVDTSNVETYGELQKLFNDLEAEFHKTYARIFHVLGESEAAVRTQYIQSFFGKSARELNTTSNCFRCCGNAFYSVPIGPEYTLVVIDGYELIVVDEKKTDLCPNICNSEATGDGLQLRFNIREQPGQKCAMHADDKLMRVGWPQELKAIGNFITATELQAMPRVRTAVSRSQLRWLELTLMDCLHNNQNVVIACHAPLHPLLVQDRSTLVSNWTELLKLFMRYTVVKLVLCGRQPNHGSHPIPGTLPYTRDHDILYYSLPQVGNLDDHCGAPFATLVADLGYDFVRIRGKAIGLSQAHKDSGYFSTFRPKRKLSMNERDYSFNGAFMKSI